MEKQLNRVYKEMDELSLKILQLMEQLIRSKVRLEELMKMGFLDMAKARYIMGNKNVSSLQLPTECSEEFLPQYTVSASVDETLGHTLYKLNNMSLNDVEPGIERTLVKKRKGKLDEITSTSTDMQEDEESVKIINPLKWFGVLVPQNLRRAQTCFQTVLQLVVGIATIQSELSTWLLLGMLVVEIFSFEQQCPSTDTSGFSMTIVSRRDAKGRWKVLTKNKQLSPQDDPRDLVIDVGQFTTPCGDSEIVEWVSTVSLNSNEELNHSTMAEENTEESTSKYTLENASTEQGITSAEGMITTESTLTTSSTQNTSTASFDGYVEFPGIGFIKVHKDHSVTWDVANDTCVKEGAQLVYVDSDQKAKVFETLYLKYWKKASTTSGRYYVIHVGFHDRIRKGDYITVSGNRVDETRWAPGQPTGVEGHCGSARFDGMMYVVNCDLETYFFCEKHGVK